MQSFTCMQEYLVEKIQPTGATTALQSQKWILYYVQLVQKGKKSDWAYVYT